LEKEETKKKRERRKRNREVNPTTLSEKAFATEMYVLDAVYP
jgi:hypothetical protein